MTSGHLWKITYQMLNSYNNWLTKSVLFFFFFLSSMQTRWFMAHHNKNFVWYYWLLQSSFFRWPISFSLVCSEEVETKKNVEQIHSSHPKERKRKLNSFRELWCIDDEFVRYKNVASKPCCEECNPVKCPLHSHPSAAICIAKPSHSTNFSSMKKDGM